jgi:hypothetical protein
LLQESNLPLRVDRGPGAFEKSGSPQDFRPIGCIVPDSDFVPSVTPDDFPLFHVPVHCMGGKENACQRWSTQGPLTDSHTVTHAGISLSWAETREFVFAVASIEDRMPVAEQSEALYAALLEALRAKGKFHLHRIWNYLPRITELENGAERYQLFNQGRKRAFAASGYTLSDGAPAACALGTQVGVLQVAILAGIRSSIAIENPRQVSSYHYPKQYGAEPPIFSRAAWLHQPSGKDILFVSGTASIVGHETLHAGDPAEQTNEAIRNIRAVLHAANEKAAANLWTLEGLAGCVYIRHATDYPVVKRLMLGFGMQNFCYVQADICRQDLLLEIEAEGSARNGP